MSTNSDIVRLFRQTYVRRSISQHAKPLSGFISFLRDLEETNRPLTTLDLSIYETVVGLDGLLPITEAIKSISTLERVILTDSHCTDTGLKAILAALTESACPVQVLVIDGCKLTDRAGPALARFVQRTPTLLLLSACHNKLGKAVLPLLQSMLAVQSIEVLRLSSSGLTSDVWPALGHMLPHCDNLLELDISSNEIGVPASEWREFGSFGQALGENASLHTLNIAGNNLPQKAANILVDGLQHNHTLWQLDTGYNRFSSQAVNAIETMCRNNRTGADPDAVQTSPEDTKLSPGDLSVDPQTRESETPRQTPSQSQSQSSKPSSRAQSQFIARMESYRGVVSKADKYLSSQTPSHSGALPALMNQAAREIMHLYELLRVQDTFLAESAADTRVVRTELTRLEDAVEARDTTIAQLRQDLQESRRLLGQRTGELEDHRARVDRLSVELEAADRGKEQLSQALLRQQSEQDDVSAGNAMLLEKIARLEQTVKAAEEEGARNSAIWAKEKASLLAAKDSMTVSNRSLVAQLTNAHNVIAIRDRTVSVLESRLQSVDRDLTMKDAALNATATRLQSAESELAMATSPQTPIRAVITPIGGRGQPLDLDLED
ncbi:Chromosome partition protein Smc [Carpediemonas membranifera]|uniref:Chromosome partition protein Smc n=1 Tax=Carpediemonas membranifera TaxID=201153 RepID=A0A8J6BZT0_9EUKA|nr:Chromosome partition protein Smc [Carpediemonas membranifera]|eukprot:KAG9395826.1 Chromosome partition protein Smc [Carpediemonas membranifera]